MKKIVTFIRESRDEVLYRTTWPTLPELIANSIVVLVSILLVTLLLFSIDSLSSWLLRGIYGLLGG